MALLIVTHDPGAIWPHVSSLKNDPALTRSLDIVQDIITLLILGHVKVTLKIFAVAYVHIWFGLDLSIVGLLIIIAISTRR